MLLKFKQLDLIAVLAIYYLAVCLIFPLGNYPINDDWYFSFPAAELAKSFRFIPISGSAVWGYPQTVLGAIFIKFFGFSYVWLRLFGIAALSAILWIQGKALEHAPLPVRVTAFLSFCFFVPVFVNSASFMTDLPFLALWAASCLCWFKVFENQTLKNLTFATLLTCIAIAQRQFGVFLLPIILLFRILHSGFKLDRKALLLFASIAIQALFYLTLDYYWKVILQVPVQQIPAPDINRTLDLLFKSLSYIGLIASPLLILGMKDFFADLRKNRILTIALSILLFVLLGSTLKRIQHEQLMPYFENTFSKYGMFAFGDLIRGPRPILILKSVGILLSIYSTLFGVIFLGQLYIWGKALLKDKKSTKAAFLIVSALFYWLAISVLLKHCWDRYLFIVLLSGVTLSALSIKTIPSKFTKAIAAMITLVFILSGVFIGQDFMRWSDARWDAIGWLQTQGYKTQEIYGGHEWNVEKIQRPNPNGLFEIVEEEELIMAEVKFLAPEDAPEKILKKFHYSSWMSSGTIIAIVRGNNGKAL